MQVEHAMGAPVNMLSMRSYHQDPYTHFTAADGSNDADQVVRGGHATVTDVLASDLDVRYNTPVTKV
jgi:hypothetical protein